MRNILTVGQLAGVFAIANQSHLDYPKTQGKTVLHTMFLASIVHLSL